VNHDKPANSSPFFNSLLGVPKSQQFLSGRMNCSFRGQEASASPQEQADRASADQPARSPHARRACTRGGARRHKAPPAL